MGTRLDLQSLLESVSGVTAVYFQPPESVKIQHPCIIYERISADAKFADNIHYKYQLRYKVTVVDKNPDSEIPGQVAMLPLCSFERHYTAANLHHDVYNLYY